MCQRERRITLNNRQSHAMKLNKKYSKGESLQRRKSLTPKINNTPNDLLTQATLEIATFVGLKIS